MFSKKYKPNKPRVPFYKKEIIYDEKKLYNYGINKLSVRDYGRKELEKLMARYQKDFSMIGQVLDKLETQGYLSDERRVRSMLSQYNSRESIHKTKSRIVQKGLKEDFVKNIIEEINDNTPIYIEDSEHNVETRNAIALLEKKYKVFNKEMWEKMTRFLAGKGFKYDDISKSIKAFSKKDEI